METGALSLRRAVTGYSEPGKAVAPASSLQDGVGFGGGRLMNDGHSLGKRAFMDKGNNSGASHAERIGILGELRLYCAFTPPLRLTPIRP